jgi:hypothetical protein
VVVESRLRSRDEAVLDITDPGMHQCERGQPCQRRGYTDVMEDHWLSLITHRPVRTSFLPSWFSEELCIYMDCVGMAGLLLCYSHLHGRDLLRQCWRVSCLNSHPKSSTSYGCFKILFRPHFDLGFLLLILLHLSSC